MYLVLFPTYFSDKFFVSFLLLLAVKGTVSVISSDPPSKESNARFTDAPFSDQV